MRCRQILVNQFRFQRRSLSEAMSENEDDEDDQNPFKIGAWMEGDSLAPPCQADSEVVDAILDFAQPNASSVLYDLGCGDGRICIAGAQRFHCQAVGCEIEENLCQKFRSRIEELSLQQSVKCVQGDLLDLDLSSATIIMLYLLPEAVEMLKPRLVERLLAGAVLVCNTWGPKGLQPSAVTNCGRLNNVRLLKYDRSSIM